MTMLPNIESLIFCFEGSVCFIFVSVIGGANMIVTFLSKGGAAIMGHGNVMDNAGEDFSSLYFHGVLKDKSPLSCTL